VLLACTSAQAGRVVLVGVDGAGWSVLDPLLAEGVAPHFAALARDGVTAELETVEPVISPTVWTSIATGRSPAAHGITDFLKNALDRRVPTVFERLAAAGHRVGLFDYLSTWPPSALPEGFLVPGWMRRDDSVTPPDAFARAGRTPPYRYSLEGLRTRAEYLANSRRELREKAPQWLALAKAFDVEVGALTFYSVDALGHRFWHDAFPGSVDGDAPPPDPASAGVIREAYLGVDAALGEIRAGLAPEDVLIVVSDHGFEAGDGGRRVWTSSLEDSFRAAGLEAGRDPFLFASQFAAVTVRVKPGPLAERDALTERIAATLRALRAAPDGDPLYSVFVVDGAERPPGAERPFGERLRQWAVRQGAWWMFGVEFGTEAHAWVLAQPREKVLNALWPDGRVSVNGSERPVAELAAPDDFTGKHHPTAIFLAAGGPIRREPARLRLSVLEIAPLLVHLAGEPLPDDLERPLPAALLDPAWLAAHPVRQVPAASLPAPPRPDGSGADAGDEALRERLRSMGYLE